MTAPVDVDAGQRVLDAWDHDEELRRPIYEYLDFYEMLATGVNSGIFDHGVVDRASGTRIMKVFESYQGLIKKLREEQARPRMYEELQTLAADLDRQRAAALRSTGRIR